MGISKLYDFIGFHPILDDLIRFRTALLEYGQLCSMLDTYVRFLTFTSDFE